MNYFLLDQNELGIRWHCPSRALLRLIADRRRHTGTAGRRRNSNGRSRLIGTILAMCLERPKPSIVAYILGVCSFARGASKGGNYSRNEDYESVTCTETANGRLLYTHKQ
jgi:hypothetical protein